MLEFVGQFIDGSVLPMIIHHGGTWKVDPDQRPVCTAVPEAIAAGFEQLRFSYSQMIPELPPILQGDWEYILMANQFVAFPSRWSDNANNSLKLH